MIIFLIGLTYQAKLSENCKPKPKPIKNGCIRLFEHINFKGKSIDICRNQKVLVRWWNNRSSSACNSKGKYWWRLYRLMKYRGKSLTLRPGRCLRNFLSYKFNDQVTSVKRYIPENKPSPTPKPKPTPTPKPKPTPKPIKTGCLRVYEHINKAGRYKDFCGSISNISGWWNNKASSACAGKGGKFRFRLYGLTGYKGQQLIINPGECNTNFVKNRFNDKLSSILRAYRPGPGEWSKFYPPRRNCVRVYEKRNFKGRSAIFCRKSTAIRGWWNNLASSACVSLGVKHWDLFDTFHWRGQKLRIAPGKCVNDFKDFKFNYKLSSVRSYIPRRTHL